MRMRKGMLFATVLLFGLLGAGCKKKPPVTENHQPAGDTDSGTTEGTQPDRTRFPESDDPSGTDLDAEGGPLKDVYFDFDRYEIRPDQRPTLERNARWLSGNTGQGVILEGHCDERGTEEYNLALGDRRANSVKSYLLNLGVSGSRLRTVSYGKAYPVDPGHDEEAWAKNRRVHHTLVAPKVGAARPAGDAR